MKLTEILSAQCVRVPLESTDKTGVITELVDLLAEAGSITDRDAVLRAVLERESTRSTAIGYSLAVPHGKSPGCPKLAIAAGKPAHPIAFGSRDGEPSNIIVLLASPPDQTGPHIQALARISRLMLAEPFRRALNEASNADEFYDVIKKHEA
jgi:mannitol/fructose-specific phosphotransferase system IIA component (Ntr-type)